MQTTKRPERRGKILIDRDFQLKFIGRLGGLLFFYLLLFLVIAIVAPVVFTFLGDPPEWALMETAFRVEVLLRLILAPLVCTFLCVFAHGVLETFRIAGPNYRFKQVFGAVQKLRVPRGVQVRKGDYLQDTAKEFDAALVAVHDQFRAMRDETRAAAAKVRAAFGRVEGEAATEAFEAMARVEHLAERCELVGPAPRCAPMDAPVEPTPVAPVETAAAAS
jgi:hypothetical protein